MNGTPKTIGQLLVSRILVIPAEAGIQEIKICNWMPAFAGMTTFCFFQHFHGGSDAILTALEAVHYSGRIMESD